MWPLFKGTHCARFRNRPLPRFPSCFMQEIQKWNVTCFLFSKKKKKKKLSPHSNFWFIGFMDMKHQYQWLSISKDKILFSTVFKRLRCFANSYRVISLKSSHLALIRSNKSLEKNKWKSLPKCNHSNTTDASRNGVLICFIPHFLNWNLSREKSHREQSWFCNYWIMQNCIQPAY